VKWIFRNVNKIPIPPIVALAMGLHSVTKDETTIETKLDYQTYIIT